MSMKTRIPSTISFKRIFLVLIPTFLFCANIVFARSSLRRSDLVFIPQGENPPVILDRKAMQAQSKSVLPWPVLSKASEIHRTEEQIEEQWKRYSYGSRIDKNLFDQGSVAELNLRASKLWIQILNCYQNNPKAAREGYLSKKINCKEKTAELKKAIQDFHSNVQSYLHSTKLEEDDVRLLRNQNINTEVAFPEVHPFFVQSVLESLSRLKIYSYLDYSTKQVMQQHYSAQSEAALWAAYHLQTNQSNWREKTPPALNTPPSLFNHLLVLRYLPKKQCANWGLWPSAALSLFHGVSSALQWMSNKQTHTVGEVQWTFHRTHSNLSDSCGALHHLPDPYFQKWHTVIKDYRSIAEFYGKK